MTLVFNWIAIIFFKMYVFSVEEIDVNWWRSKGSFWRLAFIFFGWGRVSLIFPFLSLSPISPWASWGRKLSYFNVHLGGQPQVLKLQTLCFSPTGSFHQHHCWVGDSAAHLLGSADRAENPMYRLSWSGRLCGLAPSACTKSQHRLWSPTLVHSLLYTVTFPLVEALKISL